jgi:hypothetical protein
MFVFVKLTNAVGGDQVRESVKIGRREFFNERFPIVQSSLIAEDHYPIPDVLPSSASGAGHSSEWELVCQLAIPAPYKNLQLSIPLTIRHRT